MLPAALHWNKIQERKTVWDDFANPSLKMIARALAYKVGELRERMRLLQGDRRANVELLETHKKLNTSEINTMRESNKEMRAKFAQLKRTDGDVGAEAQISAMKRDLLKRRKVYDELKGISTSSAAKLETLKDEVRACELESKRPTEEDSPLTRSIRVLENRLDKAMIKYNEATSIRKTYEQIFHRLKEERVGFDNQLSALERTLAAKQRDYEELLLLSGDANHAREIAQMELDRVRGGYEEERMRREVRALRVPLANEEIGRPGQEA